MEVTGSGNYEFNDIKEACRALMLRRKAIWYGLTGRGILFFAAAFYLAIAAHLDYPDWLPLLVVVALWGSVLWWSPLLSARRLWSHNPNLRGQHEIRFDDKGMVRTGQTSRAEVNWEGFISWKEGQQQFSLYTSPGSLVVIPKRFFANTVQMDALRQLLMAKIASRK